MPTAPLYGLTHLYGCSSWAPVDGKQYSDADGTVVEASGPFGGGTAPDNDNFLQSIWTIGSLDGDGRPDGVGAQLRPLASFDGELGPQPFPDFFRKGYANAFPSRYSAKFLLDMNAPGPNGEPSPQFFDWPLLLVIKPPPELLSLMANTLRTSSGVSAVGANLFPNNLFRVHIEETSLPEVESEGPEAYEWYAGSAALFNADNLPFLITDGSDGSYPQFFTPQDTASAVLYAQQNPVWIPVVMEGPGMSTNGPLNVTISYPHSAARGG